jgi:hypothetical protein
VNHDKSSASGVLWAEEAQQWIIWESLQNYDSRCNVPTTTTSRGVEESYMGNKEENPAICPMPLAICNCVMEGIDQTPT